MPINRKEVRLRPLPLRITPLQFSRLTEARARDSLAIQEHVRRAIDVYLDLVEKRASRDAERREAASPQPESTPESPAATPALNAAPKPRSRTPRGAYALR